MSRYITTKIPFSLYKLALAKGGQILSALLVYLMLCELYRQIVVPIYHFGGFNLADESKHELVIPILLLFLMVVPTRVESMRTLFALISFYFLLLPAGVLCALQGNDFLVFVVITASVFATLVFSYLFDNFISFSGNDISNCNSNKQSTKQVYFWGLFSVLVVVLFAVVLHVDFITTISFLDVYDRRFDFNESLYFPLNYLLPFAAGPLASFLAVFSASKREWGKLTLVLICGFLFFAFSTHKAFLFIPLFSVGVYFAVRSRLGLFYFFSIGFLGASIITLFAMDGLADLLGNVYANRLIFLPANISYVYFDEFSKIPSLYWAESKFGLGVFQSPLQLNSSNYIGFVMVGSEKISANTGWIANGYMNFAWIGIAFYSVIIGFFLAALNRFSRRFDDYVIQAGFVAFIFNIVTSNDLLTAMLTGGVLLMVILLWILPSRSRFYKKSAEICSKNA